MKKLSLAEQYIEDIVKDRIPSCEYVKLCVERHLRDLKDGVNRGLFFDKNAANYVIKYFDFMTFTSGRQFAGKPFKLSGPQAFITWCLYGWKKADGYRRFNYAYIEVPRKFGKSTYAGGLALYMTDADGEDSAENFSIATKEDQAKKCFREASNIVKRSPMLRKHLNVQRKSIISEETFSFFKPLGSDSNTEDSHNPHFVIVDEYHAHPNDGMVDVQKSGMGMREQPLMLFITTAGFNTASVCYAEHEECVKILRGVYNQDNKFAIIYTLDPEDEWDDESKWIKAQPHLGNIVKLDYMRKEALEAKHRRGSKLNNFKTKNLNIWTVHEDSFIPDERFIQCNQGLTWQKMIGRDVYGGLDLAENKDLNSLSLFSPDEDVHKVWTFFWCPERKILEDEDGVTYALWADQGWIKSTPGETIDIDTIVRDILHIFSQVNLKGVSFDPARAYHGVTQGLQKEIYNHEDLFHSHRQGFISMDTPTREFENLILDKKIDHGGNPVLRWNNSNAVKENDAAGNIKLSKKLSKNKIDGMISAIMSLSEYMSNFDGDANSYFRDLLNKTGSIL